MQTFGEIASDTYMMFFFILDQFYYSIHGVSPHFKSLYMNSKDHSCDYIEVTTALYKGQVLLPRSFTHFNQARPQDTWLEETVKGKIVTRIVFT